MRHIMEITLENIFELFAQSEKQRAVERAAYEVQRERERQDWQQQQAAIFGEFEKKREVERREFEKKREVERLELEKKREVERLELEKKREVERLELEKKREVERLELEKKREVERLELESKVAEEKISRDKEKAASDREFKRFSRELGRKLGEFSNVLGLYAEAQTKERIRKMFAKLGIELRSMTTHYVEEDGKGGFLYEIDILLYNTIYAIVVEVKNQLKKDDVDEHLARLDKCIMSPPRGTEGKILLGAVATMIVSQEVETYAKRKGFYVIKPSGKSVKIANDASFKPKEWQTMS
jgi:hypothetical protein